MKNATYQDLLEWIQKMSPEQRQCHATVHLAVMDEFVPVQANALKVETESDVLDEGHPYIEVTEF